MSRVDYVSNFRDVVRDKQGTGKTDGLLRLVKALDASSEPVALDFLAAATGLPRKSVDTVVRALEQAGAVDVERNHVGTILTARLRDTIVPDRTKSVVAQPLSKPQPTVQAPTVRTS